MIRLHRLVVWTFVFHLSTQSNITKLRYKWLQGDFNWEAAVETNVPSEISSTPTLGSGHWFVPVISEQCQSMGICEDVPNYPEEHVKAVLQEAKLLQPLRFGGDFSNSDMVSPEGLRFNDGNYQDLCRSEKKYIEPRAGKNINNEWQFIVNTKDGLRQKFLVEVCKNQNYACSDVVTFASNYAGWCKQKYIIRTMMALDKDGKLTRGQYELPSCCSCVYAPNNYYRK